jgi:hypothetical protein
MALSVVDCADERIWNVPIAVVATAIKNLKQTTTYYID